MNFDQLINYLKHMKKKVQKMVPESELEKNMVRVSNYIVSKWADDKDFMLSEKELDSLLNPQKFKYNFLNKFNIKKLFNKYFNLN